MNTVTSNDGTMIAFERLGEGPPIILVAGAMATRADYMPLAALLAPHFTVLNPDRRGRGDSGDTLPYTAAREVEDIDALISAAGGSALLFGHSSGATLALEVARLLPGKVTKLALYEPPLLVDDSRPPVPEDYVARLNAATASGRPGDAVEIFMTKAAGIPAEFVAQMRNDPSWAACEAVAHTIAYDGTIVGDGMRGSPLPLKKWAAVTVPTLVLDGEKSDAWVHAGMQALAAILPNAQRRTLAEQDHGADPQVLTPVLVEFFTA